MSPKILFLKSGSFSNINNKVHQFLKSEFSGHIIETIDAWEILKKRTFIFCYLLNIYFFITEYGYDIVIGNKKRKEWLQWFFATSFISLQISREVKKICRGKEFKFTFQTQSIFNGKLEKTPHFIYTDHTTQTNRLYPDVNAKQYMRSKRFINKSEVKAYDNASLIFTFGSLTASSLINQYKIPEKKIITVYAGCNTNIENKFNPEKYFLKNILFVGTEWERKGGPLLLKAFEMVLKQHPDANLIIVGCTPDVSHLPNCTVVGKVRVEDMASYYEKATLFCLPTIREPFGIVFIEAMSFKLPIIANKIGSIPDIVINGKNGYLIQNDSMEYSKIICNLLSDPQKCKEMGENGFKFAKSEFNWEIVGKKIKNSINNFLISDGELDKTKKYFD
jgi:glycosyltransferase involved in cell wall biosynthesis